jgi:hypothetical protein
VSQPKGIWEFYALVDEIEKALIDADESTWAERLSRAIAGGSTSGETLTTVGLELVALINSDAPRRASIEVEVVEADHFVSAALGPR